MGFMFHVELICTDESCAESSEATVFSLETLDLLACNSCGCAVQWLAIDNAVELRPALRAEQAPANPPLAA
jgi:hypothetical protein